MSRASFFAQLFDVAADVGLAGLAASPSAYTTAGKKKTECTPCAAAARRDQAAARVTQVTGKPTAGPVPSLIAPRRKAGG